MRTSHTKRNHNKYIKALFFCWVTSYILVCYYISKLFFHLVPWTRPFSRFPLSFSLFLILDLILKKWLTKQTRTKERKIGNVVFQNFSPFIFCWPSYIKWLFWGSFFLILFFVPPHFTAGNEILKRPCREAKVAIGSFQLLRPRSNRYKRATTNGMPKAFGQQLTYRLLFLFYMSILAA